MFYAKTLMLKAARVAANWEWEGKVKSSWVAKLYVAGAAFKKPFSIVKSGVYFGDWYILKGMFYLYLELITGYFNLFNSLNRLCIHR